MSQQVNGTKTRGWTLRAATLGTAFCLWASVAAAGPITCTGGDDPLFPGSAERCQTFSAFYNSANTSNTYFFDGGIFENTLSFPDGVLLDMDVWMSAYFVIPGNPVFDARIPPGYEPEPFLTATGPRWIYFRVEDLQDDPSSGPPQEGVHYSGNWVQDIVWFGDGIYQNPEVLHDNRPLNAVNGFADVITVPDSFDPFVEPDFGSCELCS